MINFRFLRVEKMAKRTAMVDSESKSLMMYLLSYLQSLFILDPSTHELPSKVRTGWSICSYSWVALTEIWGATLGVATLGE